MIAAEGDQVGLVPPVKLQLKKAMKANVKDLELNLDRIATGPSLKEQEDDEIETLERRVKTYKYALIGSLVIFVIILTVEAAMIFSGGFGMCYTKNTPYSLPETTTPMDDEDFKYRLRRSVDKGCQPGDVDCLKKTAGGRSNCVSAMRSICHPAAASAIKESPKDKSDIVCHDASLPLGTLYDNILKNKETRDYVLSQLSHCREIPVTVCPA